MDASNSFALTNPNTKVKVSSTFQNNSAAYGKQFLFDQNEDTSWYSDQGKFQYIILFLDDPAHVTGIDIICSGGFCPKVRL